MSVQGRYGGVFDIDLFGTSPAVAYKSFSQSIILGTREKREHRRAT